MERHTLVLLGGVLILGILLFVRYSHFTLHYEGFVDAPSKEMAKLPKPEGTSTVPNTMPGAVSRDPTEELASFKDIAALLDLMKTYNSYYEKFLINLTKNSEYTLMHTKSVAYSIKLQAQIDTGKIVDNLKFISTERNKYKKAIESIRRNEPLYKAENMKKAKTVTKNVVSETGPVRLTDLKHAIARARAEQKRIDDIRSEAPDFKQRSLILEKIQLDLQQIHDKIMRKDMKESQIPVGKKELLNFLTNVEDPTSKISPLPRLSPAQISKKVALSTKKQQASKTNKAKQVGKQQKLQVASNFEDYPEDRAIISTLKSFDKKHVEGFTSNISEEEVFNVPTYDNSDDVIPSNEGFSNYTNNYIHDSEDRDEFRESTGKIVVPKDYKKALDKLKTSMRDMTWDMQIGVGYDPNVTVQRRITERLNQISNEIESGRLGKTQMKAKFMELEVLKQQLETYNRRNMSSSVETPDATTYNSNYGSANTSDNNPLNAPEYVYQVEEDAYPQAQGKIRNGKLVVEQKILKSIEKPLASNDYKIRPGYEMTTDEIATRGSSASFDPELVGGPDYKKNVKFLCSQIKAAGLGNPKEFGCIANQETDVGPSYSWKGNYKMVCARLGNTWGEWYPQMFGCPKPDVSHTQAPKINSDCSASPPPPVEYVPKPQCHR
jgi:hypothetical protein